MSHSAASGERSAVGGFSYQYNHIAAIAYDLILAHDFVSLRLVDPTAGKVDDLVVHRRSSVEGYQFKNTDTSGALTFHGLTGSLGSGGLTEIRALADGWLSLRGGAQGVIVHYVTTRPASTNDSLGKPTDAVQPDPAHFSAFLNAVLRPIAFDGMELGDVPTEWHGALSRLLLATGLEEADHLPFLRALRIDASTSSQTFTMGTARGDDLALLSSRLFDLVARSHAVVDLDLDAVLNLTGWTSRPALRSAHTFPVDLEMYSPLSSAMDLVETSVDAYDSGYVAVLGPPGTGKSTLLSQATSGRLDRVVRYFAYVPGAGGARNRLMGAAYLHDMIVLLAEAGLRGASRSLPSDDVIHARQQFQEQLDAASVEFAQSGRKTILVVDGLDHVTTGGVGDDGLLGELPRSDELPPGVVIVVGTRTLETLNPSARQQIEDRGAFVDLGIHRLTEQGVLDVCRRATVTKDLDASVHRAIVVRVAGHPLTLGYILNSLAMDEATNAVTSIEAVPAYSGDVATQYTEVWRALDASPQVRGLLGVCSRLRVPFNSEWLLTWAGVDDVHQFGRQLSFLFRRSHDGLRFFHDSFRQFAADRTGEFEEGQPDPAIEAALQTKIADLCRDASDRTIHAEEIHHRWNAGDGERVLALAQTARFRAQLQDFRSNDDVRADVIVALEAATEAVDIPAFLRHLLSLAELADREQLLKDVDLPLVLYSSGLVDEAIRYVGVESRHAPLPQAYNLALRLARAGDPIGGQVFDAADIDGLTDPGKLIVSGHENDAAAAWSRAATMFRPIEYVIGTCLLHLDAATSPTTDHYHRGESRGRFDAMIESLLAELEERREVAMLEAVDSALLDAASNYGTLEDEEQRLTTFATLVDCRVRIHRILVDEDQAGATPAERLDRLDSVLDGHRIFDSTALDAANLFASEGRYAEALAFLRSEPPYRALAVQDLSSSGDDDIVSRAFRIWRIRELAASSETATEQPLDSVPPDSATPAGDSIAATAATHGDLAAIDLAERVDRAVRVLAHIDALTRLGIAQPSHEVIARLVPLLETFPAKEATGFSGTLSIIRRHRPDMLELIIDVAGRHGAAALTEIARILEQRIATRAQDWLPELQLRLARRIADNGVVAGWESQALLAWEADAASLDGYSRLEALAEISREHSRQGDLDGAQRVALKIIPAAFGVGYRKDYQFDEWVPWLGRALAETGPPLLDDVRFLARVLVAANPMTEGAPGIAAARLPAELAPHSPIEAVNLFEFLVGTGTADHLESLAGLLEVFLSDLDDTDADLLSLIGELITGIVVPADTHAHRSLASQFRSNALRLLGPDVGHDLCTAIVEGTDVVALATTRAAWRHALLGDSSPSDVSSNGDSGSSDSEYGTLTLVDGTVIPETLVLERAPDVEALMALRSQEASDSTFSWYDEIARRAFSRDDILAAEPHFDPASRRGSAAFAALAGQAERVADAALAARLARLVFNADDPNSWSVHWGGGSRRRAAGVLVRSEPGQGLREALEDLQACLLSSRYLPGTLIDDLADIVESLDPSATGRSTWPEVCEHIQGMVAGLELTSSDPLADRDERWWLPPQPDDQMRTDAPSGTRHAIAQLIVHHITHPTFLMQSAAIRITIQGLRRRVPEVASALADFGDRIADDSALEPLSRCVRGGADDLTDEMKDTLASLTDRLAESPTASIRDPLNGGIQPDGRALSGTYRLALPPPSIGIGAAPAMLSPFEPTYAAMADATGLELRSINAVAETYAREAIVQLPADEAVREQLKAAGVSLALPRRAYLASRLAVGRVTCDLVDAGMLIATPPLRTFRMCDPGLLTAEPVERPGQVPSPPTAGHDQTHATWIDEAQSRLDEYVRASTSDGYTLIGLRSRLKVLNWDRLNENVTVSTAIAPADPADETDGFIHTERWYLSDLAGPAFPRQPIPGDGLILSNAIGNFGQLGDDWVALDPGVAALLDWRPDEARPGTWLTSNGRPALRQLWWVDGWYGHLGQAFDDTEAEGYAVILTGDGLTELVASVGPLRRTFNFTRNGRNGGGISHDHEDRIQ